MCHYDDGHGACALPPNRIGRTHCRHDGRGGVGKGSPPHDYALMMGLCACVTIVWQVCGLAPAAVVGNDAMLVEGGRLTDYKIRLPVTVVEGGRLVGYKIRLPVSVVEAASSAGPLRR